MAGRHAGSWGYSGEEVVLLVGAGGWVGSVVVLVGPDLAFEFAGVGEERVGRVDLRCVGQEGAVAGGEVGLAADAGRHRQGVFEREF